MLIDGPIEAGCLRHRRSRSSRTPSMLIDGPIEAFRSKTVRLSSRSRLRRCSSTAPLKRISNNSNRDYIGADSVDAHRRPH